MKQSRSETLCNEESRRFGVVDNPENVRKAWLRWCGHVIRREEGKLVRYIMERRDRKKMWGGRHCRDGEESKVEMVWTRNNKR
jgi:hypothetical protein